jgi:two-component system alkaline phosphatase synthesis response regulator PhoP
LDAVFLRRDPLTKKILLVDDESLIVLLMKRRLEHGGYIVITAESGQDGLAKAKKDKPDLIVVDHTMPKMTGLELCKLIKGDSDLKNIPVIIYTANTETGLEAQCIGAGATGVITKPLVAELLGLIKRVLAGEKINWAEYLSE